MAKPLKYKLVAHTVLPSGYPEKLWRDNFKAGLHPVHDMSVHTFRRRVRFAGRSQEIVIFAALALNPDYQVMKDREKADRLARRQLSLKFKEEG